MPSRGVTTEVRAIEEVPGGRRVTVNVRQPRPVPKVLGALPLSFRARARALVSIGVVDVTSDKVRTADIRRFTRIESKRLLEETTALRIWEFKVLVQNEDY